MVDKIWNYDNLFPSEVEIPDISIIDMFRNSVDKYPDTHCTYFKGKFRTYKEIEQDVNRFAHVLTQLGVKKGDRVAVLVPNSPQYIISFLAVHSIGAIFSAISSLNSAKEIAFQLNDSEAKVIFTFDLSLDRVRQIIDDTPTKHVIAGSVADELPQPLKFLYKAVKARKNPKIIDEIVYSKIMNEASTERIDVEINNKEDIAVLQYTGGTTGIQKGAMLTHYNLVAQAVILSNWPKWLREKEPQHPVRMLAALPLSHIFGLATTLLWPIYIAGTMFIVPDPRDLEDLMGTISKHKVHSFFAIPIMFLKAAEHPKIDSYDLSSLVLCISGGESLPRITAEKFEAKTGNTLVEGYGLTECSPVTHVNPMDKERRRIGAIGIPVPNTLAMIVDLETQKEITEYGKSGELWVRSPSIMKGYWNNKEASDNVLVEGWLRTGDLATMDEEGYFTIVDRLKDMIIVSGYKVWPTEVEEALYAHPSINQAAVIGEKTEVGENVKAVIVLEPGHDEIPYEEFKEYCKKHLAPYKVPKIIEYREELPRTAVGKVLRKELRVSSANTSAQSLPVETKKKV